MTDLDNEYDNQEDCKGTYDCACYNCDLYNSQSTSTYDEFKSRTAD